MLASVNKGVGERGFRVCPDCGRAEPEYGPGFTATKLIRGGNPVSHQHPLEIGVVCTGVAEGPFYLGHRFPTDTLLLRIKVDDPLRLGSTMMPGLISRAARMALTTLVEAISLAASRQLQIEEGEMSGWWAPVLGGPTDEAQIYLYDLLPGGAGYARAVGEAIVGVLDETESILSSCDCPFSCYRCLRHYGNNYIHASLDRHLALALLNHVRYGSIPEIAEERQQIDLFGLGEYLRLRGFNFEIGRQIDGIKVPMVVEAEGGSLWVDVHHPLVDPTLRPSAVSEASKTAFQELVEVDNYTLVHDLPTAVSRLPISHRDSS